MAVRSSARPTIDVKGASSWPGSNVNWSVRRESSRVRTRPIGRGSLINTMRSCGHL